MGAPLYGTNLVRLLYLDEAGKDAHAPWLCVAGVLVHGDHQWPELTNRISALVEKYVPEEDRHGFAFHATDIFHGSGVFDRRKPEWADPTKRYRVLDDLAKIIDDMTLPLVSGSYEKSSFGLGIYDPMDAQKHESKVIHSIAAIDCLRWADKWLELFAPTELATVVHEDGTRAKTMIKEGLKLLRDEKLMALVNTSPSLLALPLRRIIDTVHFAEKADAPGLQMADLCAFILGRALKNLPTPQYATEVILKHRGWANIVEREATSLAGAEPSSEPLA